MGRGETQEFVFLTHTPKGGTGKRDDKLYTASNLDQVFTIKEFFLISQMIWEQQVDDRRTCSGFRQTRGPEPSNAFRLINRTHSTSMVSIRRV